MTSKHTPGPWKARGDHVGVWHRYKSGVKDMVHFVALATVSIPHRRKEVRSYHEGVAELTANAELIAAAPDLLAALEAIEAQWSAGNFSRDESLWEPMRVAIAKAKGGS